MGLVVKKDYLKRFSRPSLLLYPLALLILYELYCLSYSSAKMLSNSNELYKKYDDLKLYVTDYLIHRVMNPLYVFDSPESWQAPILPVDELFPNHRLLQDNWKIIRDEALYISNKTTLLQSAAKSSPAAFKSLSRYSQNYNNQTSIDFWKTSILKFYGKEFPEVMAACPKTTKLLSQLPNVDVAMFSVMEPGATIPVHRGPLRGAVRYHLPLLVPGYDKDGQELQKNKRLRMKALRANNTLNQCLIIVGEDITMHFGRYRGSKPTNMITGSAHGKSYPTYKHVWKPGEGVLFDDTYAHSVANHHPMKTRRIVLFLDVRRPSPAKLGYYFHFGTILFSIIRWTGLPSILFFRNAKNEKPIFRKVNETTTESSTGSGNRNGKGSDEKELSTTNRKLIERCSHKESAYIHY